MRNWILRLIDRDPWYVILQYHGNIGIGVQAWRGRFQGRRELFVLFQLLMVELRIVYTFRLRHPHP